MLNSSEKEDPKRKSLVLYVWAKKLAKMATDLTEVTWEGKGYGRIIKYGQGKYRGEVVEESYQLESEKKIKEMSKGLDKDILKTINKMMGLRGFKDRFKG